MLTGLFAATGRGIMQAADGAGRCCILVAQSTLTLRQVHRVMRQLKQQIDMAGFGSLLVLSLISGLTGMIMVMQMGPSLAQYNALSTLGGIISVTFTRELGPIWAAVIILARVGSAMAAELGTMKVNEEVEALKVMSIDPVRFLVMPRILALLLVAPVLTAFADLVGIIGGAIVAKSLFGVTYDQFQDSARSFLELKDFYSGLLKGAVFGVIIGAIACRQGLSADGGAEGVGRVTTSTVRLCVIFVLVADLVLTRIVFAGGG